LSLEDVASRLKKDVAQIVAWENGEDHPTYGQLETLAYSCYKRPIAIFFFPQPPDEEDQHADFRLLPEHEFAKLAPETRYSIRTMKARRESLIELSGGRNPSKRLIFRDLAITRSHVPSDFPDKIRDYLGIDLETQWRWRNAEQALKAWREAIQDSGVFVFKGPLTQQGISGFCLDDSEFPIIFINNANAKTRQIFTLFHELAHILFRENGMTLTDDSFIDSLPTEDRDLEAACNRLASEILVPSDVFDNDVAGWDGDPEQIAEFAKRYCVSREVIGRKLLERGSIDRETYRELARLWNEEWLMRTRSGMGNYYNNQSAYLGSHYLRLAFSQYYDGRCTLAELSDHLGVKARNVEKLETKMLASA